jgi:NADPH2:quinone reductase
MRGIVVRRGGGPEVLVLEELPEPEPAAGDVVVETRAIGVNFADLWVRAMADGEPTVPGIEVAGVVTAVGSAVSGLAAGDRVVAVPGYVRGATPSASACPPRASGRCPPGSSSRWRRRPRSTT